jgi:hypothetical protein
MRENFISLAFAAQNMGKRGTTENILRNGTKHLYSLAPLILDQIPCEHINYSNQAPNAERDVASGSAIHDDYKTD